MGAGKVAGLEIFGIYFWLKKSHPYQYFEYVHPDPQNNQNFKSKRNCADIFFTYNYMRVLINIYPSQWKQLKDPVDLHSARPITHLSIYLSIHTIRDFVSRRKVGTGPRREALR